MGGKSHDIVGADVVQMHLTEERSPALLGFMDHPRAYDKKAFQVYVDERLGLSSVAVNRVVRSDGLVIGQ